MSGSSDSSDCPRCGGKQTLMTSNDWKPHDVVSGDCLACGYRYYTIMEVMTVKELLEQRKEYDSRLRKVVSNKRTKAYDESYGIKK